MVPDITLNDGNRVPQVGFGLWQITDKIVFDSAFTAALQAGYRHFDSAQIYGNESMLGEAVRNSGLERSDFWLTTKLNPQDMTLGRSRSTVQASLEKLQTDYIDLLLIHFPVPFVRQSAWNLLEELQQQGKVRSIGVSNYSVRQLKQLKRYAKVVPAVNQIELHVFLQQPELIAYCHDNGIVIEAYSPLAHAADTSNRAVQGIANKHGKSYAQIMLRWLIQQDAIVLPKSVTSSRIAENIQLFDFALDSDDIERLRSENKNLYTCRPTRFARFMP